MVCLVGYGTAQDPFNEARSAALADAAGAKLCPDQLRFSSALRGVDAIPSLRQLLSGGSRGQPDSLDSPLLLHQFRHFDADVSAMAYGRSRPGRYGDIEMGGMFTVMKIR